MEEEKEAAISASIDVGNTICAASLLIDPADINKHPKIIKEAQQEIKKMDVLVCGQCHSVYHFLEQFQAHRITGACTGVSTFKDMNVNESKAQVWAFLLWKGSQLLEENEGSWAVYQRWCKLGIDVKESWIAAGARVQAFTKLGSARMQEVRAKMIKTKLSTNDQLEEGEILNHSEYDSDLDSEEDPEKELIKMNKKSEENGVNKTTTNTTVYKPQGVQVALDKNIRLGKRTDKLANTIKESVVERILAKRYNPRKKMYEYLIKWEGLMHDKNTWELPGHMSTCQHLVDAFERNLARQKEAKAAAQANLVRKQNQVKQQAGPSGIITTSGGRPVRTSKQKALDQVKQWCGNISDRDDELGLKRRMGSDSEDLDEKRMRLDYDSGSEDEWQADEIELERHTTVGKPKLLQKTTNIIAKKPMTANEVARSIGLASPDRPTSPPIVLNNPKNVVKVLQNQMPNLASGVYIMSKKDGILKLEASSNILANTKNIVCVQKTGGRPPANIIRVGPNIGPTKIRMIPKTVTTTGPSTSSLAAESAVRLSPGMSRPGLAPKIKTTIKPAVRVTSAGQKERLQAQRMHVGMPHLSVIRRGGTGRAIGNRLHQIPSFIDALEPDVNSDTSEDDFDPFPKDLPPPEPDSPPREFTLDPLTGLILGQAEGEPEPQKEDTSISLQLVSETAKETDKKFPVSIMKQDSPELSAGQDMPSLILNDAESSQDALNENSITGETTTTITLPETGEPLMITGEDGVVYQVAGQNEEGQTLLVAQGADGQMYVTAATTTTDDSQNSILTLDSAVAEAMEDTENVVVNEMEPLTINTVEDQDGGDDGNSQVVAQLVKAELPSPGGTRKVVLLLPDGNLLMTEVDAEQYAALELDK